MVNIHQPSRLWVILSFNVDWSILPSGMFFKAFFANSADLNETAPWEQSDLGLHCFLRQSV